eukprot:CAMPEP_0206184316 /NCGR_PEP_ID=MMETSP0166-20121206/1152_1 /ASSEMBLY_ACC=CAM_ASM_000260 /TAXON_ID=95228 /ORGANISM="Vannella robusta, Strain DIVA3 518/3/11/1/6" /LENGTH=82 /DNA_ID=CAMNT_0053599321 /DNA_START=265 /DNA_END=510 /DNA_ORIENTATION=-
MSDYLSISLRHIGSLLRVSDSTRNDCVFVKVKTQSQLHYQDTQIAMDSTVEDLHYTISQALDIPVGDILHVQHEGSLISNDE